MPLSDTVYVERRFQRSIRIDTDLQNPDALTGFICPESSAAVLSTMANHITESGRPHSLGPALMAAANQASLLP